MLEAALRQVALPRNLAYVSGLTMNYTCGGAASAGISCEFIPAIEATV